jgi:hypothetical protein
VVEKNCTLYMLEKGVILLNNELNGLKNEFDNYLSPKPVFTDEDKKRIRKKINQSRTFNRVSPRLIPNILTAALLFIGVFFIGNFLLNELNFSQQETSMPEPTRSGTEETPFNAPASDTKASKDEGVLEAERNFLSEELIEIYNRFAETKDDEVLRGLRPIEIFKFYFYAYEQKDFETQYALFIQDDMYIKVFPTVSDFLSAVQSENREDQLKFIEEEIKNNDTLEEVINSERNAVILVSAEKALGFGLTLNENGIWKVNWLPFQ